MNELKLKFGEREIVLTKTLGVYWSGSISLDEFDGEWSATIQRPYHAYTDYLPTAQAALDALAEKVRGHIRELWGLLGGFETEARTRKLASGVVVTDRLCRECGNILSSVMGPIA